MNKRIQPDDLTSTINAMLAEYGDEVAKAMGTAVRNTANKARKEVRANSDSSWKRYKSGWSVKITEGRLEVKAQVYNKTKYMLTHLLEFGHPLVRGGRKVGNVKGRSHIASVNEGTGDEVIKELESLL